MSHDVSGDVLTDISVFKLGDHCGTEAVEGMATIEPQRFLQSPESVQRALAGFERIVSEYATPKAPPPAASPSSPKAG